MRCRLATLGLLALTPITASVGWWLMPEPRISEATCDRIRAGMTLAEVEEILGVGSESELILFDFKGKLDETKYTGGKMWTDGGRMIYVTFFNDSVCLKCFHEFTLRDRISNWYEGVEPHPIMGRYKILDAAA